MKIKSYINLFGTELTSSDQSLPELYIPSSTGWISYAQTDLANFWVDGSDERLMLNTLSETLFQEHFGSRRLLNSYKLVNNAPAAYGKTAEQAKKILMPSIEEYMKTRMTNWARMMNVAYSEYEPLTTYDRHEDITDTLTMSGAEETTKTGKESITRTGSVDHSKSGKEINTPKGTETVTTQNNVNGYNSSDSVPVSDGTETTSFNQREDELSFDQRKDTTTYNQQKDETGFTDRKDTLSFNNRQNENVRDGHIWGYDKDPQKLILSEWEIRKRDILLEILGEIADHFLLAIY